MKPYHYQRFRPLVDFLLKITPPFLNKKLINKVYDHSFYQETRERKVECFKKVAAILAQHLDFQTVFEIGCGQGQLLKELQATGKDVLGCEFSEAGIHGADERITVFKADATAAIHINHPFDLVICIEVAEHIRKKHSSQLVANCAQLGRQVVFTAAPKGQSGVGHINLQPYSFWIDLFAEQGMLHQVSLSEKIKRQMQSENVLSWIISNLMIFARDTSCQDGRS